MNQIAADSDNHTGIGRLLQAAEQAMAVNNYVEAIQQLRLARQEASRRSPDRLKDVEAREAVVENYLESLLADVQALMAADDVPQDRINDLLDQVEAVQPGQPKAQDLRRELLETILPQRERRTYDAAREACKRLWSRETEFLAAHVSANEILQACFQGAIDVAEQARSKYPNSLLMVGLVKEATLAYDQARARYELRTTAEETGDFKSLIANLEKEPDRGKLIPWIGRTGQGHPPISVDEAIRQAKQLAADFAEQKARQYLQQAEQFMGSQAPQAAKEQLLKGLALFQLDDEIKAILNYYLKETVEPAIAALAAAKQVLHQAETSGDPYEGWQLAVQVAKTFPGVAETQQTLLPRLVREAERCLMEGQHKLKSYLADEAEAQARRAQELAQIVRDHAPRLGLNNLDGPADRAWEQANDLLAAAQAEQRLDQEIAATVKTIDDLLKREPGAAAHQWQALAPNYSDEVFGRFSTLRQLRSRVELHSSFHTLLARLDSAFASGRLDSIRQAIEECRDSGNQAPSPDFRQLLAEMQEKLELRLDYLNGLEEMSEGGDADKALRLFEKVAARKNHPDAGPAAVEAEKIRSNQALAEEVKHALEKAENLLLKKTPPQPRQAYEALLPLAGKASRQKRAVESRLAEARQAWADQLVADINRELAQTEPRPARLRDLALELEQELKPPYPVEARQRALAGAAVAEAHVHQRLNEWSLAQRKWQDALAHDQLNSSYKLGWQQARKRAAEIELDQLKGGSKDNEATVQGFFADLERDIPSDPEVRLWRARYYANEAEQARTDIYQQQRSYGIAREALAATNDALARAEGGSQKLAGQVLDLTKKVEAAERLLARQEAIERRLKVNRSLLEFAKANQDAMTLLAEQRHNTALAEWWTTARDQAIEALISNQQGLDVEDTWGRFDVRSKILTLNADHEEAQQLLRELPVLAEKASQEISQIVRDREGTMVPVPDPLQVIEEQYKTATRTQDTARATYDILQRFKDKVTNPTAQGLADSLRRELETLQGFVNEVEELRRLQTRALDFLRQAQVDGKWKEFDAIWQQMSAKVPGHRTIRALHDRQNYLKTRRDELLALRQQLVEAISREELVLARQLMNLMELDAQVGDPHDEFGLRATVQVNDPLNNERIRSWQLLRSWLEERQGQLDYLASWLVFAGASDLPTAESLVVTPSPEGMVDWQEVNEQAQEQARYGRFQEAIHLVSLALNGDGSDGWFDPNERLLALKVAEQRLAPPLTSAQVLTRRGQRLLQAAQSRRQKIEPDTEAAEALLTSLQQRQYEWNGEYNELTRAFQELQKAQSSFLSRKQRIKQAREKVYRSLAICEQIAPRHPNLHGLRQHPLLGG